MRDDDGKVLTYGEYRLNQLTEECYIVSKNLNTSYTECLNLPIRELNSLLKLIANDAKRQQEELDKLKTENRR